MPHFLDTNVLLYSISRSQAEQEKRNRARALIERDDGAISVQVLQEFYVQATRASRPDPVTHDIAVGLIATWRRFALQDITLSVLTAALQIKAIHKFSYWDSAIIAAARALGCHTLFTEDMSHGREIDGMVITNPFR